jgi:hypothetical protein
VALAFDTISRTLLTILRVSNTILAFPNNEWQKLCLTAMEWEKKLFLQSPDKVGNSTHLKTQNCSF